MYDHSTRDCFATTSWGRLRCIQLAYCAFFSCCICFSSRLVIAILHCFSQSTLKASDCLWGFLNVVQLCATHGWSFCLSIFRIARSWVRMSKMQFLQLPQCTTGSPRAKVRQWQQGSHHYVGWWFFHHDCIEKPSISEPNKRSGISEF